MPYDYYTTVPHRTVTVTVQAMCSIYINLRRSFLLNLISSHDHGPSDDNAMAPNSDTLTLPQGPRQQQPTKPH